MFLRRIFNRHKGSSSLRNVGLVLLVLIYSGNPAPGRVLPLEPQLVLVVLFLIFLLMRRPNRIFTTDFVVIAVIFATILLVQCIDFSFYPFVTISGFFVRLLIGYTLMRLVDDFPHAFVRAMVWLALLSFVFYLPYLFLAASGISVEGVITRISELLGTASNARRPLFLYTFMGDYSSRNAGMFWEPGAFAGYLALSLVFLAIIKKKIQLQDYRKYLLILSIALFTTMSTTGYIIYPLLLLLHYDWSAVTLKKSIGRGLLACFVVMPLIAVVSIYSYYEFDFLRNKIEYQLQKVEFKERMWEKTRFGSLVFDWKYIEKRPFTGWGLYSKTRYALDPGREELTGMGNGFSDFTAKFGIVGMLTWLVAVFTGFRRFVGNKVSSATLICVIILIVLQGEAFLNFPFFLGLAFLGVFNSNLNGPHAFNKPVIKRISVRW